LQELYKDFLTQAKEDFEERKTQIEELREERDRYKNDRNDLRDRLEKMEETLRNLQSDYTSNKMESDRKIAQLGRKVEGMRPFLCGDIGCKKRQLVTLFAKEENDDGGNTQ
jgi:chromosome segregation ATPase